MRVPRMLRRGNAHGPGSADEPLSARLRAATDDAHRAAEGSPFIGALLAGGLPYEAFAALVGQHYVIYSALERAGEAMCYDRLAGGFVTDALARVPALEQDLAFLYGPQWRSAIVALPATRAYVARLASVASLWPEAFIAHHYVRYLGDLSGGAFVATAVRGRYALPGISGTSFYEFGDIPQRGRFKRDYRARLDALPLSLHQARGLVEEAVVAFDLNRGVFADLARQHPVVV